VTTKENASIHEAYLSLHHLPVGLRQSWWNMESFLNCCQLWDVDKHLCHSILVSKDFMTEPKSDGYLTVEVVGCERMKHSFRFDAALLVFLQGYRITRVFVIGLATEGNTHL